MTSEDIRAELDKVPFVPFRLHLVSGKVVNVPFASAAWLLQNSILVFKQPKALSHSAAGYDVVSLRNIEKVEQHSNGKQRRKK